MYKRADIVYDLKGGYLLALAAAASEDAEVPAEAQKTGNQAKRRRKA
jgi:hypothetical protein